MARRELITPRLRLRAPRAADAPRLSELCDAQVARMTTRIPHPNPAGSVLEALRAMRRGGETLYVIDDGAAQGMIGLGPNGLGYWLGAEARGRGYATEAARALLIHAFGPLGRRRVAAAVFSDNPASRRVLERLGFAETGRSHAYSLGRDALVEQTEMILTRGAWAGLTRASAGSRSAA